MRHALSITAALLFALALAPAPGHSQETGQSQAGPEEIARVAELLNGRWVLASGEEAARRTVQQAIERTTEGMFPIVRGTARGQLRDANPINGAVQFEISPERIHAVFESGTYTSAPGRPVQGRQPGSGDEMEYVQLVREGRLEQIFTTERGRRWSLFTPASDGQTMKMQVTVQGSILPRPLQYEIEYRRAQGE